MSGDASEQCDVGVSLNKSFLFLQTLGARKRRAAMRVGATRAVKCGHRAKQLKGWKSAATLAAFDALTTVQKKHWESMSARTAARLSRRAFVCSVAVPISATGA
jgi:hypothetical protein